MTTGDEVYSLRFFSHQSAEPEPGFELGSTAGESSMLTARLHMLYQMQIWISYFLPNYLAIFDQLKCWSFPEFWLAALFWETTQRKQHYQSTQ